MFENVSFVMVSESASWVDVQMWSDWFV